MQKNLSAVVVRPTKYEVELIIFAKFLPVAIELTAATVLLKMLTVHSKVCCFYARHK